MRNRDGWEEGERELARGSRVKGREMQEGELASGERERNMGRGSERET